jgi:serine/threonine protein kinase
VLGLALGNGGRAEVHPGLDLNPQRVVAIKLLRPNLASDPRPRAHFDTEAHSAARFRHPQVVSIFDIGEDNVAPFFGGARD